jgi:hypothetical protein
MRKQYKTVMLATAFATATLMFVGQAFAAHPQNITLKDSLGNEILDGDTTAYSAKQTCGFCHDYDAIERHSFHSQLGANQHKGWDAFKYGNWNSVADKSKPWVQSPGHVGKW